MAEPVTAGKSITHFRIEQNIKRLAAEKLRMQKENRSKEDANDGDEVDEPSPKHSFS